MTQMYHHHQIDLIFVSDNELIIMWKVMRGTIRNRLGTGTLKINIFSPDLRFGIEHGVRINYRINHVESYRLWNASSSNKYSTNIGSDQFRF